ncbi:hypothetical protein H4CHR_05289 [Variovorax sp. PBS-H4]|uniref:hypothetical protein n=1 Tax=Variovorax sp. PBS-H4 TaxID=434008 RepID=UPI001316D3AC|nr:hypothetical protein [Variovorax sp. PBS-H4]VTU40568.1 hypothetical protein H4CHR_05289 [Variovorax sp. PBS-H4]
MSTMDENGTDDLSDEALRRALLHAPDHTAVPNWRLRKAILDHAHEAVMPFEPAEAAEPVRPWWKRLWGIGGDQEGASRMPRNAAFATLLVGVLIAVLWQREPVPGSRPDGEAPVIAPAQRSEPPPAPASPPPAAPAQAPAPPPQAVERALLSSQDIPGGPIPAPELPTEAVPAPAPAPAQDARPPRSAERPAPARAPSELARRPANDAALSSPDGAAATESRKKEAAMSAGQQAAASPPAAAAVPAPAAPPEPPSFSALSQWSRLSITQRGGSSRSLSRSEAQDLSALLGSAAISAVGAQPLAGQPEWRVTLERGNGDVLATFELGRGQVRWREGRGGATTGTPSPASMAALREALQHALEQPAQPAPRTELKPAPQQPAGSEAVPSAAPTR